MIFPFLLILSLLFLIQQLHHYFAMDDRRFQIESLDGYPFHGTREELRGLVLRRRMPIVVFLPFQLGQRLLPYRDYLLRMPTDRNKGADGAERGNVFFTRQTHWTAVLTILASFSGQTGTCCEVY